MSRRSHLICLGLPLMLVGCGGGGGSSVSSSNAGSALTFAANSIVYGTANGSGIDFEVNEMAADGSNIRTVVTDVPGTVLLFALDAAASGQYVLAADPTGGGTYGIYLSSGLSLTGAKTLASPSFIYVNSLSVTADGKNVVFSAIDSTGLSNLYVVPTGGGTPVSYGLSDASAVSPSDSDTIAYAAPAGGSGNDEIFTRSLKAGASGDSTQLTTGASNDGLPAFSPDGTKLAFWDLTTGANVLILDTLSSGAMTSLPNPSGVTAQGEAFSPDGTRLVLAGSLGSVGDIYTQPTDGSAAPTGILSSPSSLLGTYGIYWTDSNGRIAGGIQGLSSASRRRAIKR